MTNHASTHPAVPTGTDRILKLPAVTATVGLSRSTIYEKMAAGKFPRPVKLGDVAVGWRESEIQAWIESLPRAS